jgi:putative ABC transport system ATP-binding protein
MTAAHGPAAHAGPAEHPDRGASPVVELREVRKHYRVGDEVVRAVDGVSLAVRPGAMVALYGPSGSGKSTLLRLLAAIERPDAGKIIVDGTDVTGMEERRAAEFRMNVLGWIGQDSDLVDGASPVDNAAFKLICAGMKIRDARRLALEALGDVGLTIRKGQTAETLSLGERQRVMIARALSLNPRVLLADEPTGNLDTERTRQVLELLRTVTHRRGMATILVTHDERAKEYADLAYTLRDGALTPLPRSGRPAG